MNLQKGDSIVETTTRDHLFLLRRLDPTPNGRTIEVDFSPKLSKLSNKILRTFPSLNLDGKVHMPSFVIEADGENYLEHEKLYAALHEKKLIEAMEEKEQIFVPKPSKKNSCCCVCRTLYQDYLTHVNSPDHQSNMQKSTFNFDINQLCLGFSADKRSNLSANKQTQEVLLEKPRKKRKVQTKRKGGNRNQESGISTMIDSLALLPNRVSSQVIA